MNARPLKMIMLRNRLTEVDPYSVSKYEAELVLQDIGSQNGMDLVIIRRHWFMVLD